MSFKRTKGPRELSTEQEDDADLAGELIIEDSEDDDSSIAEDQNDTENQDPKLSFLEELVWNRIRQSELDYRSIQGPLKS